MGELQGWFGLAIELIVFVAAVLTAVWKLVKQPFERELNGYGIRLTKLESSCSANAEKSHANERVLERHQFEHNASMERMGRLEAMVERSIHETEKKRDMLLDEDRKISDRLTKIETKLDYLTRQRMDN